MYLRHAVPLFTAAVSLTLASVPVGGLNANASGREHHAPAHACSPYVDIDGFSDELDKTTLNGIPVAELSGLTHDTNGRVLAVADDSYLFTLDQHDNKPLDAQPLAYPDGADVDSEAVAVNPDGTRLISDETTPGVLTFTRSGRFVGRLPVPDALKVAPAGRATHNLTFEGLTLLAGNRTLIASMEGALAGDAPDIRRFQTWQRIGNSNRFRPGPQFAFRTDPGLDISDITSTGDGRLLVLERTYTAGVGNTVHLVLADLTHAGDVTSTAAVEDDQPGVRPVASRLLADIGACPSLGATTKQAQPNPLLDNIEGVTVNGRGKDGKLNLLMVSDDNQRPSQITRLYSLTAWLPHS
ncbi:esterase-like activity of phytase family protein [Streptomyces mirabilis]|uniref:esterase-like activity of phytase family protein n=1 Tax=Streptomyces mirabilis TaxID=68239 RepID=UPI0036483907